MNITALIQSYPGRTSEELARLSGTDPSNCRRGARRAVERGEIVRRTRGDGAPVFFPVGRQSEPVINGDRGYQAPYTNEVIDGDFEDITPPSAGNHPPGRFVPSPSSTGRALVPVPTGGAAFNNQMAETIRRNALGPHRGRTPIAGLDRMSVQLNSLFATDPDGADITTPLQLQHIRAQDEHNKWLREEYARRQAEEKEAAERRQKEEAEERQKREMNEAIMAMLGAGDLKSRNDPVRHGEPSPAGGHGDDALPEQAEAEAWQDRVDPDDLSEEDEAELDELIDDYRRRREDEANNPDKYGSKSWEDEKTGITTVQVGMPRARPLPPRARAAMRSRLRQEEAREDVASTRVLELFRGGKPPCRPPASAGSSPADVGPGPATQPADEREPVDERKPPADQRPSLWARLRPHLVTPTKPIFK